MFICRDVQPSRRWNNQSRDEDIVLSLGCALLSILSDFRMRSRQGLSFLELNVRVVILTNTGRPRVGSRDSDKQSIARRLECTL